MGNPTIKPGMSDETGRLIASSINALADAIQAGNGAEATQKVLGIDRTRRVNFKENTHDTRNYAYTYI